MLAGACGGETACSTCHIILAPDVYKKLPEATEEEEDMLDLAAGLTKTSRLGCQVRVLRHSVCCSSHAFALAAELHRISLKRTLVHLVIRFANGIMQVIATSDLEGMVVQLPKEVSNMMSKE